MGPSVVRVVSAKLTRVSGIVAPDLKRIPSCPTVVASGSFVEDRLVRGSTAEAYVILEASSCPVIFLRAGGEVDAIAGSV